MLPQLTDDLLLDAYRNAVRLGLDLEFIQILRSEIGRRRLTRSDVRVN